MSDKLDRLVAEKVMGWKWWRAVPCEWFDGNGRDSLLAHCLRQNASFMLSPEQSKTSDWIKESDGNGMTVMHPKFKPMEGVWNGWGKPTPFSTDIAAAWEVVEHLRKRRSATDKLDDPTWSVALNGSGDRWICDVSDWRGRMDVSACNKEACVAICLAALRAVGVPESEIQEAMR